MTNSLLRLFCAGAAAALLAGCASFNHLASEVASYGSWPAERKPGSWVFERLPSQQTRPELQQKLEDAAAPALEAAGFSRAADAAGADVVVQLGARVTGNDRYLWDDPIGWRGGIAYGRRGPYFAPFWFGPPTPTYEREVALLIRDRRTGTPLYETRSSNDGASPSIESLLPAMFAAALADFPTPAVSPRRVVTKIDPSKP
jgi:Domain of unknown function (DUF4136)